MPEFKLKVVAGAKWRTNRFASRAHKVDESLVRCWRKDEAKLKEKCNALHESAKCFQLDGGGRKVKDDEVEEKRFHWVSDRREKLHATVTEVFLLQWRVARKGIGKKALELSTVDGFTVSHGWTTISMKRDGLSLHQKTRAPIAAFAPGLGAQSHSVFELYAKNDIHLPYTVAVDETAAWFDSDSQTATNSGEKTVPLAISGHEKLSVTDGKKKSFVIFNVERQGQRGSESWRGRTTGGSMMSPSPTG